MNEPPFSIRCEAGSREAEIVLYDVIDRYWGVSAEQFVRELRDLGPLDRIHLRLNSPGGSYFEGVAIYTVLKQHAAKVTVHVDGIAGSMASVVAMAGDEIEMADGSFVMIHNPAQIVAGEADELRQMADVLDKIKQQIVGIYAARTKQSAEKITALMDAETWMSPDEAVALGFADRKTTQLAIAAAVDVTRFTNLPKSLLANQGATMSENKNTPPAAPAAPAAPIAATFAELKAGLVGADSEFICQQLEASATLPAAQSSWMAEQARRLEGARAEATEAKAAAEAAKRTPGVPPLGNGNGQPDDKAGDPIAAWHQALVAKEIANPRLSQAAVIKAVVREQPELHEEYLAAYNAANGHARGKAASIK